MNYDKKDEEDNNLIIRINKFRYTIYYYTVFKNLEERM